MRKEVLSMQGLLVSGLTSKRFIGATNDVFLLLDRVKGTYIL